MPQAGLSPRHMARFLVLSLASAFSFLFNTTNPHLFFSYFKSTTFPKPPLEFVWNFSGLAATAAPQINNNLPNVPPTLAPLHEPLPHWAQYRNAHLLNTPTQNLYFVLSSPLIRNLHVFAPHMSLLPALLGSWSRALRQTFIDLGDYLQLALQLPGILSQLLS